MLGTTTPLPPDPANIQGLILRGYTHPYSCHLMFKFQSATVALNTMAFFAALYPKVQPATNWGTNKPVSMLNIGISFNGLQILKVANTQNSTFPFEFQQGPWSQGSQQSLGDFNESSPLNWWYNNFQNTDVHCIVHTYGLTQTALDQMVTFVTSSATANGLTELLPLNSGDGRLYQSTVEGDPAKIHFGYTDGISEPALTTPTSASTENQADLDNFLIGYPKLSIIDPAPSGNASNNPEAAFAMDGCYNAFRILYQDVAAFNNFLIAQASDPTNVAKLAFLRLSQDELVEWFAAKLVGRWRNGSPLMLSPLAPDPATAKSENFVYSDPSAKNPDVPSASKCPFSAHTRVANPRDQTLSPSQGEGTFGPPRILRRGMPYGAELVGNTNDNVDRGLIGLFLCGSIAQQFEKLYGWMNFNNFSPSPDYSVTHPPQDALLGNRPTSPNLGEYQGVVLTFTIPIQVTPTQSDEIVISNLPTLIQTRGTAYCLLPSLKALNSLATGVML